MHFVDFLEWGGSITGLVGSIMVASHTRVSKYGWMLFLVSSLSLSAFAVILGKYGLMVQQMGFAAINVFGLIRAWLKK